MFRSDIVLVKFSVVRCIADEAAQTAFLSASTRANRLIGDWGSIDRIVYNIYVDVDEGYSHPSFLPGKVFARHCVSSLLRTRLFNVGVFMLCGLSLKLLTDNRVYEYTGHRRTCLVPRGDVRRSNGDAFESSRTDRRE